MSTNELFPRIERWGPPIPRKKIPKTIKDFIKLRFANNNIPLDRIIDTLCFIATDPSHKDAYVSCKFLLENIFPKEEAGKERKSIDISVLYKNPPKGDVVVGDG